jgi:hypothetical protein
MIRFIIFYCAIRFIGIQHGMATLKEFEKSFSAATGEDTGSIRYVARVLQDADLLPTGKRGGKNSPQLTAEHGAMFTLGYYGSTASPKNAARMAKALSTLQADEGGPDILNEFTELIKVASGRQSHRSQVNNVAVNRVYFSLWAEWPSIKIYWYKLSEGDEWGEKSPYQTEYLVLHDCPITTPAQKTPAVEVAGDVFQVIADALALGADDE